MLGPFAHPVAFCWMLLRVVGQSLKPVKLLVPCKRAHYCRPTSPNIVAPVLAVVCKRMQQLPTMLGPAVHRGKDTTHKSLQIMRNQRAWPQQYWKSCASRSNIVALRFGDHGTKEMLGVVGWKVWLVSNFARQHATTCNRVCKRTQHVTSNNVGSCWPTMLRPFARDLRLLSRILSKDDNLILGYPFWSQPLWYVVNFMKKVLSCKSRHITILIQRLYEFDYQAGARNY